MLTLRKITKIFNQGTQDEKRALDDFSLEVAKSDFITIIGSNGAGKSTFLSVLSGLTEPDSGAHVDYAEKNYCDDHRRKKDENRISP